MHGNANIKTSCTRTEEEGLTSSRSPPLELNYLKLKNLN